MPPIKHTQLFDFPAYTAALKEINTATTDFGKNVGDILKRLKTDQRGVTESLQDYAGILKSLNVAQTGLEGLKTYGAEIDQTSTRLKELKAAQQGWAQIVDTSKASVRELKAEYAGLKKQYESLKPDQVDYANQVENIKSRIKEVTPQINAMNASIRASSTGIKAAEGSYQLMNAELTEMKNQLKTMPGAFDSVTGKLNKTNTEAVELARKIAVLDTTLKNADASMGVFNRNVGNYKSGFNGLNVAVAQLSREIPNFAMNLQTGFLAISNNIPMLKDEIDRLKKANVELAASGEKPISIYKQLFSAIFSWNTLLSIGITLLTVYGKQIVEWIAALFKGKQAIDQQKASLDLLNQALAGTEFKNAIMQVDQLRINIDLAKKGFVDKKDVVDQYNKSIGQTTGQVKTLDQAERELAKNGEAYIKMTLLKAAANLALEKAAQAAFEEEQTRLKKAEEFLTTGNKLVQLSTRSQSAAPGGFVPTVGDPLQNEREVRQQQAERQKNELLKEEQEKRQTFEQIAQKFQRDAAEISTKYHFDFFGDLTKDQKDKNDAFNKLKDSIRKQEELLQKAAELDIKNQDLRHANGEIGETEFQRNKLAIIEAWTKKATDLELMLGKDADRGRIDDFKKNVVESQVELEKLIQKRIQEGTKIIRPDVQFGVPTHTTDDFLADREKSFKDGIDAENRAYELIKARRNTTFKDEADHLERIKAIHIKYAKDTAQAETDILVAKAQREKEIREQTKEVAIQIGQELINFAQSSVAAETQARISTLEAEKERELALVGNNAAAREKIEKEFNDRIKKEKIKQAKADKVFAAFQIAINTAQAIGRVLAEVPKFDFGVSTAVLIAAYTALGAIQVATVLSRPLPQFRKGAENAPRGAAIVGEEGYEFIKRDGKLFMTPNEASYTYLKGGEKIYTHSESKRLFEQSMRAQEAQQLADTSTLHRSLASQLAKGKEEEKIFMHARALERMNLTAAFKEAIKDIPITQMMWDERGYHEATRQRNLRIHYLNSRHKS